MLGLSVEPRVCVWGGRLDWLVILLSQLSEDGIEATTHYNMGSEDQILVLTPTRQEDFPLSPKVCLIYINNIE